MMGRILKWILGYDPDIYEQSTHFLGGDNLMRVVHPDCLSDAIQCGIHELRRCTKCGNYMVPERADAADNPCANKWLW